MKKMVKKVIRVLEAEYVEDVDSILLVGEEVNGEGKIRHQIQSSCFTFGDKDIPTEMTKLAELMIGKPIEIVFDVDLERKLKKNKSLKY